MIISCIKEKNGRKYIEHNGKPLLFYGIQLRIDDALQSGCPETEIETYFRMAAAYHFPMVAIPVRWGGDIEQCIQTGADSDLVKKVISYVNKYDLLVQWLWCGSNVCCSQAEIPSSIKDDEVNFKRIDFYNNMVIDYSNPLLLEREKTAMNCFLDMLMRLDTEKRTVCIQIENEPNFNLFLGRRKEYLAIMDEIGRTVKESNFSVMTRVNTTAPEIYLGEDPLLSEILELDGIDAVGVDVYTQDISYFSRYADYMNSLNGNFAHFAEVGAHTYNLTQIIGDILQRGNGAMLYEIRTTSIRKDYDFGLFRKSDNEWIERDGNGMVQHQWTIGEMVRETNTADIGVLNDMLKILNNELAITATDNISMVMSGTEEIIGEYSIRFNTNEESYNAFAMTVAADDGYLYCFTLAESGALELINKDKSNIYVYEYNEWKPLAMVNTKIDLKRGCAYKIG